MQAAELPSEVESHVICTDTANFAAISEYLATSSSTTTSTTSTTTTTMGVAFDYYPDRPENIDTILNGLDRYNPETTGVFQDYVAAQCENQLYDSYANLALLKL